MYEKLEKAKEFEEDGVIVDSNFCSGNGICLNIKKSRNIYNISVRTRCDNEGRGGAVPGSRNWYYFRVCGGNVGDTFIIKISNTKGLKLYRQGFKPVVKCGEDGVWKRVGNFKYWRDDNKKFVQEITIEVKQKKNYYFAYSYPFSYSDLERKIETIKRKYENSESIYFSADILIKSLQNRNLYCLTISSRKGISEEKEITLPYPCHPEQDVKNRPNQFPSKMCYLLTSRIHPGETPSSHISNGFINFILSDSQVAKTLRDQFVFKIIPCLNPDGVSQGNWRYHSLGFELNGCFYDPDVSEEPVIYGAKEYMKYLYIYQDLEFLMDLHAHVNTKNAFIFGNAHENVKDQLQNCLYPRLVSSISDHVDFMRCNFSYKRMENFTGTGRVAFYSQSHLICCYTLEVNFHSGDKPSRTIYYKKQFHEIGKSLALGLLYFFGIGEKQKKIREREILYLMREMDRRIQLWRGSNDLIVRYSYRNQLKKLLNEKLGTRRECVGALLFSRGSYPQAKEFLVKRKK